MVWIIALGLLPVFVMFLAWAIWRYKPSTVDIIVPLMFSTDAGIVALIGHLAGKLNWMILLGLFILVLAVQGFCVACTIRRRLLTGKF